jgi:N-carbamoylsarcosine amidase
MAMETIQEIKESLENIFSADSQLYQGRGFQRRIGYRKGPALVNIDRANTWTREGNPFTCDGMDVIIPGVQKLLAAARAKNCPVVFTSTAYSVTYGPNPDMGLWHHKIPFEVLRVGDKWPQIDDRIEPLPTEQLITKKRASGISTPHSIHRNSRPIKSLNPRSISAK